MAILKMRPYSYSGAKAAIFDRRRDAEGCGEKLLQAVLFHDPDFKHCAERQRKVTRKYNNKRTSPSADAYSFNRTVSTEPAERQKIEP